MPETVENFLKKKSQAKKELSEKLSFSAKKPLLGIFLENDSSEDDLGALKMFLESLSELNIEVVIITDDEENFKNYSYIKTLSYNRANRGTLLQASDLSLTLPFNDVEEMLLNGTIPITELRPEVKDYNPNSETGNSFVYKNRNAWGMFAALVRALETFKFPYDWKHIVRQGITSVKTF
jgi:hypothetical protein